jgi:hypothetical protein
MARYNLSGALAADRRQDRRTLRTHPTRRPREDIFCRSGTRYLLAGKFSCVLRRRSGSRRNRGAVLAPAEFATINPHPVQDHSQPPGDRDDRSAYPAPLSHPHAPRLQPRPFTAVGKQYLCGLVEHRARIDRYLMLEEVEAAEELPVRIFHPARDDLLIRQVMDVLEIVQADINRVGLAGLPIGR